MYYVQVFILRLRKSYSLRDFLYQACMGISEGLSNSQTVPRFVISMPFSFPIFSSILLFERGKVITSGIFSSIRPRLGLSLSAGSISVIFSVQNFNSTVTSKFLWTFPAPESEKGLYAIPITQIYIDIPPVCWVSSSLQPGLNCDARHALFEFLVVEPPYFVKFPLNL